MLIIIICYLIIFSRDATKTGHDLGRPQERTPITASERSLSPAGICIMRVLMHSAFVWNCCRNESVWESIAHLVHTKPPISPNELAEFFWKHLEKDMEQLGKATGKGLDECAVIIHLVLRNVLTQHPPGGMKCCDYKIIVVVNNIAQLPGIYVRNQLI